MYDLIVVGAGVAGLMAAGTAATAGARVLLLEKMEKPARKLRITGKGRCNVTNDKPREEFLSKVRQGAGFFEGAFTEFDNGATIGFFEKLGVKLVTERGGRVFPASGRAWEVADAMVDWARGAGVEVRCFTPVDSLWISSGRVHGVVLRSGEQLEAAAVLLATGGVSYPATGSTGDGHEMAYAAGHRIEPLRPALVPLEVEVPRGLKGLALKNVELSLLIDGVVAEERFGEMEFTEEGIVGGAIVLQISRTAVDAIADGRRVELEIDLKPALSVAKLEARIGREVEALGASATGRAILRKLLPAQLVPVMEAAWGGGEWKGLAGLLKAWRFGVRDYRPFTEAIVTAGGVDLTEVDARTMESKRIKGLYLAGELLDIDADTGGYNIQVALSTAYRAAKAIVNRMQE